jgi:hypothetical protein
MKKTFIVAIVMSLLLAMFPIGLALAATTADVEVTATPGFVSITNAPGTFDFGVITQGSVTNTTDGETVGVVVQHPGHMGPQRLIQVI